jgi:hypothetical protein
MRSNAGLVPRRIETAPRQQTEVPLLLWCPDQGGWHTGLWFGDRWLDSVALDAELRPKYWLPCPPPPRQHRNPSAGCAASAH